MLCHLQPGVAFLGSDFSGTHEAGEPSAPGVSDSSSLGSSTAHKQLGPSGMGRLAEAWHQCNVYLVRKLGNSLSDISLGEMSSAFASK